MKMDDINETEFYPIRWDAFLKHADIEDGTFSAYHLAAVSVPPPADETEIGGKKYIQTKAEK